MKQNKKTHGIRKNDYLFKELVNTQYDTVYSS